MLLEQFELISGQMEKVGAVQDFPLKSCILANHRGEGRNGKLAWGWEGKRREGQKTQDREAETA